MTNPSLLSVPQIIDAYINSTIACDMGKMDNKRLYEILDDQLSLGDIYGIQFEAFNAYADSIRCMNRYDQLVLYIGALEQEYELHRNKMDFGIVQMSLKKKLGDARTELESILK